MISNTSHDGVKFEGDGTSRTNVYCDSHWAGDHENRRPLSGFVFELANTAIT